MKRAWKLIAVPLIAATALLAAPTASRAEHGRYDYPRRDRDNTAAAIVAGIATVGLIAAIASSRDDCRPQPTYCPPPPPPRYWVPGRYETRRERVCIPGHWQTVTEPVSYHHRGWGWGHHRREACVTRQVWVPERYEWHETRVWVPGHYEVARAY